MTKRWHELVADGYAFHLSVGLDEQRMPIPYHGHDFAEVLWVEEGEGNSPHQWQAGGIQGRRPCDDTSE
jgi:hypothetical protein